MRLQLPIVGVVALSQICDLSIEQVLPLKIWEIKYASSYFGYHFLSQKSPYKLRKKTLVIQKSQDI